jgi:hypothetical protein
MKAKIIGISPTNVFACSEGFCRKILTEFIMRFVW